MGRKALRRMVSNLGEWESGHIILLILQLKRLNFASNMADSYATGGYILGVK
jgi:hypothetical protein